MLPGMPAPPPLAPPSPSPSPSPSPGASPGAWRRALRHAVTLAVIGLLAALLAPTVATLLLALRGNGPSFELAYALMLAPWAILLGGPGAFVLGLVFGWMVLVLAWSGINRRDIRIGLAVLVATLAWGLADALPQHPGTNPVADWLIWALSAAAPAALLTSGWIAHRITHPLPIPED